MKIDITEKEPYRLSVVYETGAEDILNKRTQVLNSFKKAPVPGFRPNKPVPLDAIKQHYKHQIEESVKRALCEDSFHNTLFEKKLKPHGQPRFNSALLTNGKFICEFDINTKPDFELAKYTDLEIPNPPETISSIEMTEKMLQELRMRYGQVEPFTESDFITKGDSVIIDHVGTIDGIEQPTLTAQGEMLTVGMSKLEDFDNNLLGMKIGDVREFDLLVPDTGLPSMLGKTIHFKVVLIMGSKTIPCPLDDSLAIKIGKKDMAELREFVHGSATVHVANEYRSKLNESIMNRLVDDNNIDVPNWLALSEAQYLAGQSKMDWNTMTDIDKERFLEMSSKNVKLSLILEKIRENEPDAQLTDQEVFDMIKQNLANTKLTTSFDDVMKEMNKTGYLQILMSRMKDEFTLDFVRKSVKVQE